MTKYCSVSIKKKVVTADTKILNSLMKEIMFAYQSLLSIVSKMSLPNCAKKQTTAFRMVHSETQFGGINSPQFVKCISLPITF